VFHVGLWLAFGMKFFLENKHTKPQTNEILHAKKEILHPDKVYFSLGAETNNASQVSCTPMGVKHETSQTSHVVAPETIHRLPRTLKTMEKMTTKTRHKHASDHIFSLGNDI